MGRCLWRVIIDKTLVMAFYYAGRMKNLTFGQIVFIASRGLNSVN